MRKPTICICENKDADQLRGNREADQRLCFLYTDSTLLLLFKSEISSFQSASVTVQPDLCRTCSETTLSVFSRGGSYFLYVTTLIMQYFPTIFMGIPQKSFQNKFMIGVPGRRSLFFMIAEMSSKQNPQSRAFR